MATDEARVVDVESLVSPPPSPHQTETPAVPETISPPSSAPTFPEIVPPSPVETEQTEPMTCDDDKVLDSHLVPESTPTTLLPGPPLTDLEAQNKFEVLTDETTETEERTDAPEPVKPSSTPFAPPSTPSVPPAVPPSPSVLPQRTPPMGRRKPAPLPTALLGLVLKVTSPQPVTTGKSKPPLQSTSAEGEEEMEVQQAQGRKRGPDEPPPKSPPKRKG